MCFKSIDETLGLWKYIGLLLSDKKIQIVDNSYDNSYTFSIYSWTTTEPVLCEASPIHAFS